MSRVIPCAACCGRRVLMNTLASIANGGPREIPCPRCRPPSKRSKRDEFSCPCCGTPTDSSYCGPCDAAGCGEQHVDSPDVCNAELLRRGYKPLGPVVSDFTWRGGRIGLVRIDLWRRPDGERAFGGVLEVLS